MAFIAGNRSVSNAPAMEELVSLNAIVDVEKQSQYETRRDDASNRHESFSTDKG